MKSKYLFAILSLGLIISNCKNKGASSDTEEAFETIEVPSEIQNGMNTLTDSEIAEGWELLFDGSSSGNWRAYQGQAMPDKWTVENGVLSFDPDRSGSGGDIVYPTYFENFHLKIDWKIAPKGNSGIFYLANETMEQIYRTGLEMQVLDNEGHPDAKQGINGNRKAGSLYDMIPVPEGMINPAGEWNSVEVKVQDRTVTHYVNGKEALSFKMDTPEWVAMVAASKFPGLNPDYAKVPKAGIIGLQDHGDKVWYRNIKVRTL